MICETALGLAIAASQFTLSWSHSVTHTLWQEQWEAGPKGLRPVEAEIQGPGAGMETPDHATRNATGWRYRLEVPYSPQVLLAASGHTQGGWLLCVMGQCQELGATAGPPIRLYWTPSCP